MCWLALCGWDVGGAHRRSGYHQGYGRRRVLSRCISEGSFFFFLDKDCRTREERGRRLARENEGEKRPLLEDRGERENEREEAAGCLVSGGRLRQALVALPLRSSPLSSSLVEGFFCLSSLTLSLSVFGFSFFLFGTLPVVHSSLELSLALPRREGK